MIEGLSELQVNDILSSNKFINKYSSYEKEVDIDKLRSLAEIINIEVENNRKPYVFQRLMQNHLHVTIPVAHLQFQ